MSSLTMTGSAHVHLPQLERVVEDDLVPLPFLGVFEGDGERLEVQLEDGFVAQQVIEGFQ